MNGMMSKCVQSLVRYLDKLVEQEEGGAVMDTKEVRFFLGKKDYSRIINFNPF